MQTIRADRVHVFCIEGGLAIFMRASLDCKSCIFSFYWQKYQIKLLKLIENAEKASFLLTTNSIVFGKCLKTILSTQFA